MPVYRFFTDQAFKESEEISIDSSEFSHLKKVLRLKEGDLLTLINGRGELAEAELYNLSKSHGSAKILTVLKEQKKLDLSLAIGLPKPSKLDDIVEKATELGVSEILIFPADRSEVKSIKPQKLDRLKLVARSALKQSGALYEPEIRVLKLEDIDVKKSESFYGDFTKEALSLKQIPSLKKALWIVGPESGFSSKEIELMREMGVKPLTLNPHTLRAETAAITGLSLLAHHLAYF